MIAMKVIVCCKAVPEGITRISLGKTNGPIDYESYSMVINESDECALEEALFLKKTLGAEIIVITVGGLIVQEILFQALAKGADRVIRIDADTAGSADIAGVLAEAIAKMGCDLVLTGTESSDNMAAQTGVFLAERLHLPHAFAVNELEVLPERNFIKVSKELGQGVHEIMELPIPAVLCIQSSSRSITIPSVMKVLQARKRQVEALSPNSPGINRLGIQILEVFDPPHNACDLIQGSPPEIAGELLRRIYAFSG